MGEGMKTSCCFVTVWVQRTVRVSNCSRTTSRTILKDVNQVGRELGR